MYHRGPSRPGRLANTGLQGGLPLPSQLVGIVPPMVGHTMKQYLIAFVAVAGLSLSAEAASLSKTYTYFSISGRTLEEIESELVKRGPQVNSTGIGHPGATEMEFTTRITYAGGSRGCEIVEAAVKVQAKVILPRWRQRAKADGDTGLIWDTFSADVKRHEETHVMISKNHARELERSLMRIGRQRDCNAAAAGAKATMNRILALHNRAQEEFDRVEGINFESRMTRLLRYRMQRIEAARQAR
jgi:predicted secreted Zn-dependent protease